MQATPFFLCSTLRMYPSTLKAASDALLALPFRLRRLALGIYRQARGGGGVRHLQTCINQIESFALKARGRSKKAKWISLYTYVHTHLILTTHQSVPSYSPGSKPGCCVIMADFSRFPGVKHKARAPIRSGTLSASILFAF